MKELINLNDDVKMSSREVAELTGKRHDHVLRDIATLNESYEEIALPKVGESTYLNSQNKTFREFLLTKMQTFDLMTGYDAILRIRVNRRWEELEKKNAKPLSQLELIIQSAQALLEQEKRMDNVEREIKEIKAQTVTRPDYFTVAGYATLNGISCGLKLASSLGRKASALCKSRDIDTESIPDPRFGRVKTYPMSILEEVFEMAIV